MTICENCHGLFFQENLSRHVQHIRIQKCDVCHEECRAAECDCGITLLNFMHEDKGAFGTLSIDPSGHESRRDNVIRAMLAHILSLEARLQGEKKTTTPELWRPGGLN